MTWLPLSVGRIEPLSAALRRSGWGAASLSVDHSAPVPIRAADPLFFSVKEGDRLLAQEAIKRSDPSSMLIWVLRQAVTHVPSSRLHSLMQTK